MIRTIGGLEYRVHSPSTYELLSVKNDAGAGDRVFVFLNAFGRWCIKYSHGDGGDVIRPFASRDAAFQMIADRRTMDCA